MSKHTPGPWKMKTVKTSCGRCHKSGDFNACVYDDDTSLNKFGRDTLLANANLIAAAPDLLETCETLKDMCRGLAVASGLSSVNGIDIENQLIKAHAAITKARGES